MGMVGGGGVKKTIPEGLVMQVHCCSSVRRTGEDVGMLGRMAVRC